MNTFPAMIDHELGRNNLRALSLALTPGIAMVRPTPVSLDKDTDCGWNARACRASQDRHGRSDDCPVHPWPRTRRTPVAPSYPLYGHRAGLRRNDLTVLASALWLAANSWA